jgi:hypothetical protein
MIFFYINDWKITFDEYIRNKLWPILNEDVVNDIALELLGIYILGGRMNFNKLTMHQKVFWVSLVWQNQNKKRIKRASRT